MWGFAKSHGSYCKKRVTIYKSILVLKLGYKIYTWRRDRQQTMLDMCGIHIAYDLIHDVYSTRNAS